tara:strand:+ start:417 stop:773 length:357 start_codon:yes stop_codon:yes gene_type:complete
MNQNLVTPPIGITYSKQINIPLLGKQNIEIEYIRKNVALIRLDGRINICGTSKLSYDNINNKELFELSDNLIKVMDQYKCKIEYPYYDKDKDVISFRLYIAKIFNKFLILKKKHLENY